MPVRSSALREPRETRTRGGRTRILGIDPGTLVVGYAILDEEAGRLLAVDFGVVRAPRRASIATRLFTIHRGIAEVIERHHPDVVALERVFFGRSASAALRIGEARGVALLTAALNGIPVSEYEPAVVKKSVVGSGTAPKSQVQEMVRRILGLASTPAPQDAADALALCICHGHRRRFNRLVPRLGARQP